MRSVLCHQALPEAHRLGSTSQERTRRREATILCAEISRGTACRAPYDSCHTSASVRQCIVQVQYQGNRWLVCRDFYASGCDQDTTSTDPPWWDMHNRSARATLACTSGEASRRLALPVDYQHWLVVHTNIIRSDQRYTARCVRPSGSGRFVMSGHTR